jgi:hypothetical protein
MSTNAVITGLGMLNREEASSAALAISPVPRISIALRIATPEDYSFIDQLQKMHSHMVGFLSRQTIQTYVGQGNVMIAHDQHTPLGYCIAKDQYLKRDDVGIVYQLNVLPLRQRNLIGATLVKAAFERAAYGCKLYSCWCAQDIQANWFWESIGFVPLAFRTGSRSKQRTHIFWQRRIREGDEVTPYWFPSQTSAGAVGEDRIVLPIPPGTHWRDAKPLVLPGLPVASTKEELPKALPGGAPVRGRPEQPKLTPAQRAAIHRAQSKALGGVPLGKKAVITGSGIKYVDRTDYIPELDAPEELMPPAKAKRPRMARQKNDPKFIKAARDLRDKFLEQVNSGQVLIACACAKYDVSRPRVLGTEADQKCITRPMLNGTQQTVSSGR